MRFHRFETNPIIRPHMDDRMGANINGPSLIRVPAWVKNPLGRYYLYFAHHQGTYIRLAYADRLDGPWTLYRPGALDLAGSFFTSHIASPDVHVLDDLREIRMYYHGYSPGESHQWTRLAVSADGLAFTARPEILGRFYWRVFRWQDAWYTLEMPGLFRRSRTGLTDFESGPQRFTPQMRHSAVQVKGETLHVYYSNAGDCPERILHAALTLQPDWHQWQVGPPTTLVKPETGYEGADCPLEPSERGALHHRAQQLRDPCVFEEDGRTYLLYAIAGESGIAIGELTGNLRN